MKCSSAPFCKTWSLAGWLKPWQAFLFPPVYLHMSLLVSLLCPDTLQSHPVPTPRPSLNSPVQQGFFFFFNQLSSTFRTSGNAKLAPFVLKKQQKKNPKIQWEVLSYCVCAFLFGKADISNRVDSVHSKGRLLVLRKMYRMEDIICRLLFLITFLLIQRLWTNTSHRIDRNIYILWTIRVSCH